MEMWIRWSWLLVVLLYGPGFSSALGRHRRQADTGYRSNQPGWGSSRALGQSASGLGSPRGNPWPPAQAISGFGALRGAQPVYGWGHRAPGRGYFPRQLTQPSSSPISVQCNEDSMVVTVTRDFYGNGKLVKPSDLTLGTQRCTAGPQSSATTVIFANGLQDCGSNLEMTADWLIYSISLDYTPTPNNVPITRSNPASVPIQCYYPRHGNVSSKAIEPTWIPFSTTVTSEERLAFSLRLMTADWSAPRSSLVFQLGDIFYIEASLDTQNHAPMTLFVDSCVATITPDVTSTPRYDIIAYNGCLMDGTLGDSSSAFLQRPQANTLRFTVDAFKFIDHDLSLIYFTCSLRAAAISQTPNPMNKACSYNKASSSWSPVEGPSGICQCCTTGTCATASGMRTAGGSFLGMPRRIGKRNVGSDPEEQGLATLGPLLVTGSSPDQMSRAGTAQASRMSTRPEPLQLWVLVAIGSVTSVLVAVVLTVAVKCLLKRFSAKESV